MLPQRHARQAGGHLLTFGFKHGAPRDADLLFDVRFLPNPHYEEELRDLTGLDQPVVDYVESSDGIDEFYERLLPLLDYLLPAYVREGKAHLTIGIGCTGGRHRSVVIAERLARGYRRQRASTWWTWSTATWRSPRAVRRRTASVAAHARPADRFLRRGRNGPVHARKDGLNGGEGRDQRLRSDRPERLPRRSRARRRHRLGRGQRHHRHRRRSPTCSSTTRSSGRSTATVEATDTGIKIDGKELQGLLRARPGRAALGRRRRRRRDRVHRPLHRPRERRQAPRGRREEGDHLGARHEPGRHRRASA